MAAPEMPSKRPQPVDLNEMVGMTAYGDPGRPIALALATISDQLDYLIRLLEERQVAPS